MQCEVKNITEKTGRNSGIELLKIIAIFLIVVFHVVQTLKYCLPSFPSGHMIDISVATTDWRTFILVLFYYFGALGNNIFFVCSAWFMLHSSKYDKRKWFFMLFEVWFLSIVILVVTYIIKQGDISSDILIRSIFPTTFSNNWYLTCYLLFYPIHPLLNSIIRNTDKRHLFRISLVLFVIYSCFDFIINEWFFPSIIILWVTIYFVVAYFQLYLKDFINNKKCIIVLFNIGLTGYIGLAIAANITGLYISYFNNKVLHWTNNCNPFLIIISIALFNLMRQLTFKNIIINYISSLSLLIYVIHENIMLRTYFRPVMWNYVYQKYWHNNILVLVLTMASVVFLFGLLSSIAYDKTIRPLIRKIGDRLYLVFKSQYLKAEAMMLNIH